MALLLSRMQQVREGVTDGRFLVMDPMVPGQRVSFTAPPQLVALFTANDDGRPVVVLGRQGSKVAEHGVEVTMESMKLRPVIPNIHPEGTADITIVAGRLCEVLSVDADADASQWLGRGGRVRWVALDSVDGQPETVEAGLLSRSEALESNVDEWIGLVRSTQRERSSRQLETVLEDLGPIPDASQPSRRAMWVAALINPPTEQGVRALGVAAEVRPAVMMGRTADIRMRVVERVLDCSIRGLRRLAGDGFSP